MTGESVNNEVLVSGDELLETVRKALAKVDVRQDVAEHVAQGLVWTSLRGIDSHGVRLLPHYVEAVKKGRITPAPDTRFTQQAPAAGLLDADHTFGHFAGMQAMHKAMDLAQENGIAAVAVANSSHCGAMSWFCFEAAKRDMLGLAFTHATPRVQTPGSNRSYFGNNPVCLVAPMEKEEPFCFDAATSAITFNKVKSLAAAGLPVAPGLVSDAEGRETTDPSQAQQLQPIGGYKGFGLSMMADILCALLSGMPFGGHVSKMYGGDMSEKRRLGHFFCALNIAAFQDPVLFKRRLRDMAHEVRNEPALDPEKPVLVPGDPENAAFARRNAEGVPLPRHVYEAVMALV